MSREYQLTPDERRELKAIFMSLWHEHGEGFNRSSLEGEVADVWFAAVCTFLAVTEHRLNESNNGANNAKNNDPTMS